MEPDTTNNVLNVDEMNSVSLPNLDDDIPYEFAIACSPHMKPDFELQVEDGCTNNHVGTAKDKQSGYADTIANMDTSQIFGSAPGAAAAEQASQNHAQSEQQVASSNPGGLQQTLFDESTTPFSSFHYRGSTADDADAHTQRSITPLSDLFNQFVDFSGGNGNPAPSSELDLTWFNKVWTDKPVEPRLSPLLEDDEMTSINGTKSQLNAIDWSQWTKTNNAQGPKAPVQEREEPRDEDEVSTVIITTPKSLSPQPTVPAVQAPPPPQASNDQHSQASRSTRALDNESQATASTRAPSLAPSSHFGAPGGHVPYLSTISVPAGLPPTGQDLLDLLGLRPGMAGIPYPISQIQHHFSLPSHFPLTRARKQALNAIYGNGFAKTLATMLGVAAEHEGLDHQWALLAAMQLKGVPIEEGVLQWVCEQNELPHGLEIGTFYRTLLGDV